MKLFSLKGRLFVLLMAIVCLVACNQANPSHAHISIVMDKTGSFANPIDGERTTAFLMKQLGIDINKRFSMGITATVFPLSNLRNNSQVLVKIAPGKGDMDIPNQRLEVQKQFERDLAQSITDIDQQAYDQNGSQLVVPFMRILQNLCKADAEQKIFLVLSDLIESTSTISFYQAKPEDIRASIDEALDEYNIDLSGVTIINIYKPSNAQEDALFDEVRAIWKEALTERGASFIYHADV